MLSRQSLRAKRTEESPNRQKWNGDQGGMKLLELTSSTNLVFCQEMGLVERAKRGRIDRIDGEGRIGGLGGSGEAIASKLCER